MVDGKATLHRGLREVYIDRTKSSFIDGKVGKLLYRGYNIDDLAQNCSFEETVYLVMNGDLPTRQQLENFDEELKRNRNVSEDIVQIINIIKDAHPMDVLGRRSLRWLPSTLM